MGPKQHHSGESAARGAGGWAGGASGRTQHVGGGDVPAHPRSRDFVLSEDAPEFALEPLRQGWRETRDVDRIAQMLNDSALAVRAAVKDRVETGKEMLVRYDHPILLLQHMVWHEGYHHGQIKLALKAMGRPLDDEEIGRVTWHLWFDKAGTGS